MEQELSIIITFHQNGKQFCLIQTKIANFMGRLINDISKTVDTLNIDIAQ